MPAAPTSPRHLGAVADPGRPQRVDVADAVDRLRDRITAARRSRHGAEAAKDGTVWLAHIDPNGTACLFTRLHDPVSDLDELYLRDLEHNLEALELPGVLVALCRDDGKPRAVDRRFVRLLTERLDDRVCELVGVVVIGPTAYRSVRTQLSRRRA